MKVGDCIKYVIYVDADGESIKPEEMHAIRTHNYVGIITAILNGRVYYRYIVLFGDVSVELHDNEMVKL